ncbi:MAG: hypothetical protein GF368_02930 [Candidatus Aenigmarchaeota archaeon]|nr:hypothetical protein [Candidatus Aenigmarchaeota archaeon]
MPISKTELEKTLLLGMLMLTKGSKEKIVPKNKITEKFARSKRKYVSRGLDRLVDKEFLEKVEGGYKFKDKGLEEGSKALTEGAQLWYMD